MKSFDINNLDYASTANQLLMMSSITSTNLFPIKQDSHVSLDKRRFPSRSFSRRICQKTTFKSDLKIFFECQFTIFYKHHSLLENFLESILLSCFCILKICISRLY